ncbi:2-phosphosulfolactate phosphatase family protein [Algivirga pacifica]|uniref:Probable 2-phosphosulfolactate phosphatase n=2 Tax=Algivirga pacifica TaxID=1162670 RepID=A0ABP9DI24_9BACT
MLPLFDLKGKIAVVVDILRATSCMVTSLATGVEKVIPVSKVEEALAYQGRGPLIAGERGGAKLQGFDLGNSPFEHMNQVGKAIVMTTTNGTRAINDAAEAEEVIIGAFLNLSAIKEYLISKTEDVVVVCAGWKNLYSMEDTLFAGALVDALGSDWEMDDAALAASTLYRSVEGNILGFMQQASHVKRLSGLNAEKDLAFCFEHDKFETIPILREGGLYAHNTRN